MNDVEKSGSISEGGARGMKGLAPKYHYGAPKSVECTDGEPGWRGGEGTRGIGYRVCVLHHEGVLFVLPARGSRRLNIQQPFRHTRPRRRLHVRVYRVYKQCRQAPRTFQRRSPVRLNVGHKGVELGRRKLSRALKSRLTLPFHAVLA